jgi:hypothetical protein
MKTLSIVLMLVALGLVAASPAAAQLRIGIGIQVAVPLLPLPPEYYREAMVAPPFRGAVLVRGHWSWDNYAGRYIWISARWVARGAQPVYVQVKPRHIPSGVAKGWWKKHGRVYAGLY